MNMKKLRELMNSYSMAPNPDHNAGGGYGKTTKLTMVPRPSADGYPYDLYELPDEEDEFDFEDPNLQKKFANKIGKYSGTKPDYVSRPKDPFSYFDDSTVGLAGENKIRKFIQSYLNETIGGSLGGGSFIRMRSRSSEPDGAVNQFGLSVPGGSQFGWSSAYPFQDKESYQPVTSLKDLMQKRERTTDRNPDLDPKDPEKWKKDIGDENWEDEQIDIYKKAMSASDTQKY